MFEIFHNLLHVAGVCPETMGISAMPEFINTYKNTWTYIKFKLNL
jgi:hypothetical protein